MNRQELIEQIRQKRSFLCVGLDSDIARIPQHLMNFDDPVLEFNRQIIEATHPYCVAYKINTAFYEARGAKGWECMQKTLAAVPPGIFVIADAKRGDIGNTSDQYAKAFFETLTFDAVTLAPYMGADSISPFFRYEGKWGIVLALTSNPGSADYELLQTGDALLYEKVILRTAGLAQPGNLMFVVGATRPEGLAAVRKLVPAHFFLVPGVGAQGGSLRDVALHGMNEDCGLLVNASRSIIYASAGESFARDAAAEARQMQQEMDRLLSTFAGI
jgi:orotidine-5'-phosphate decarboxylase